MFTNPPCVSTCLCNAPSVHIIEWGLVYLWLPISWSAVFALGSLKQFAGGGENFWRWDSSCFLKARAVLGDWTLRPYFLTCTILARGQENSLGWHVCRATLARNTCFEATNFVTRWPKQKNQHQRKGNNNNNNSNSKQHLMQHLNSLGVVALLYCEVEKRL